MTPKLPNMGASLTKVWNRSRCITFDTWDQTVLRWVPASGFCFSSARMTGLSVFKRRFTMNTLQWLSARWKEKTLLLPSPWVKSCLSVLLFPGRVLAFWCDMRQAQAPGEAQRIWMHGLGVVMDRSLWLHRLNSIQQYDGACFCKVDLSRQPLSTD